jgi:thioredoxin reductase (NADPH)
MLLCCDCVPTFLDVSDGSIELPALTAEEMNALSAHGSRRSTSRGEVLYRHGDADYDFYAVVAGEIETVAVASDGSERVIRTQRAGNFTGELDLLTNRRAFVTYRVREPGEVIVVPRAAMQSIVATHTVLGDTLLTAFIERRRRLQSQAATSTRVIGEKDSASAVEICEFLSRQSIPHEWLDPDDPDHADEVLGEVGLTRSDLPVVITTGAVLRQPTLGELGAHLGLAVPEIQDQQYDLAIIGSGPSGLASAVYAASEGLSTLCLDEFAVGGQAGMSSRIENYLGFPTGISGGDLAYRASIQAEKFGVTLSAPCRVTSMREEGGRFALHLSDGSDVAARSVIAASGAKYQRLPADGLSDFERRGVYYAATTVEAALCGSGPVVVVGGGNSAGQAAMFLAESGISVAIVIRDQDISTKMSQYLVNRLTAHPRVEIRTSTEVSAFHADADGCLTSVDVTSGEDRASLRCCALFSFVGATPSSNWLPEGVVRDARGFVLTDRALRDDDLGTAWRVADRRPLPYETSLPGVFAVGDVRAGSPKRVAAAVGEGSACIGSVHAFLERTANHR